MNTDQTIHALIFFFAMLGFVILIVSPDDPRSPRL
jgi:hypothetical protein